MGLFSSKTKTYVASTAYNMAGDENLRPNVMRSILLNTVLSNSKTGIGANIKSSILSGPMAKRKAFFRWARDNYEFGVPTATVNVSNSVPTSVAKDNLLPLLVLNSNQSLRVVSSLIDDADIHYWAENWVVNHYPELDEDEWSAEWDVLSESIKIYLTDETVHTLTAPADLLWGALGEGRKLLYITYIIETQNETTKVITQSPTTLFTYRMGSGNESFDQITSEDTSMQEFFPALVLRKDKKPINDAAYSDIYPNIKKAYKRLTGAKIEDILAQIEDNDKLDDLDAVYIVQGVSLNTEEKVGREYIYKFLKKIAEIQYANETEIELHPDPVTVEATTRYNRWLKARQEGDTNSVLYGTDAPVSNVNGFFDSPGYELKIHNKNAIRDDFRLVWKSIKETVHVGNAKTFDGNKTRGMCKVGDYWFCVGDNIHYQNLGGRSLSVFGILGMGALDQVYLFHQFSKYRYRKLTCVGLVHKNYVYGSHCVSIKASDALEDDDESGFIVPLHMPTLNALGGVKGNQLVSCSSYLVFNSYKRVKIRWYQRGIFKIILAIAGIALSLFTGGASLAVSGGILGGNVALGLTLGASATSAALVGAIANAVAAMVVSTIIQVASTKIFGEKFGAIIGVIGSFLGIMYGTQFAMHGNFNIDWGSFMRIDRLMELTNVAGRAYTAWLGADTAELQGKMDKLYENYEDKLDELKELSDEFLGMTAGEIDPMIFTDASEHFGESSEAFLSRTLLTGDDLAQLTFAMVENFAQISLEIPGSSETA